MISTVIQGKIQGVESNLLGDSSFQEIRPNCFKSALPPPMKLLYAVRVLIMVLAEIRSSSRHSTMSRSRGDIFVRGLMAFYQALLALLMKEATKML
jgi:hypothetical protein